MSKQLALELCDEAEKRMNDSMANCAISCLCDAIRELAKDEPETNPVPDLSIHRAKIAHAVNNALVAGAISTETSKKLYACLCY